MSIIRSKRSKNFTVIGNEVFSSGLSWRAIGMLTYLLSKPDDWQVSVANLVNQTKGTASPLGRDGVYATLKELASKKYVKRVDVRSDDGVFKGAEYHVFDEPFTDNPYTAEPFTAEPTQLNTDLLQKKEPKQNTDSVSQAKPDFSPVIDKWNSFAEKTGLQQIKGITTVRRKKIKSAYKLYRQTSIDLEREPMLKSELEFAETLIDVAIETHTDFHLGKSDTGWKMNFDYLLQSKIIDRVTEHGSIQA